MKRSQWRPWLSVIAGGESLISSSGGVLLAPTGQVCGLHRKLSAGLRRWRPQRSVHDPAKILLDLAITTALGGDCAAERPVPGQARSRCSAEGSLCGCPRRFGETHSWHACRRTPGAERLKRGLPCSK